MWLPHRRPRSPAGNHGQKKICISTGEGLLSGPGHCVILPLRTNTQLQGAAHLHLRAACARKELDCPPQQADKSMQLERQTHNCYHKEHGEHDAEPTPMTVLSSGCGRAVLGRWAWPCLVGGRGVPGGRLPSCWEVGTWSSDQAGWLSLRGKTTVELLISPKTSSMLEDVFFSSLAFWLQLPPVEVSEPRAEPAPQQ